MRRGLFFSLIGFSIFLVSLLFADAVIREFRAEPGVNRVQLYWKVTLESNVKGYRVERGFDPTHLSTLAFVNATEDPVDPAQGKLYHYVDQTVFKGDGRSFYYQIVVVDMQNREVTRTYVREVSPKISAVRHTWGSIKAMFR